MKDLLDKLVKKNIAETKLGTVASYIPELDKAEKDALGLCIIDVNGNEYCSGDWDTKFTIQSISKIVTLMLAILDNGEEYVFLKWEWSQQEIHSILLRSLKLQAEENLTILL